MNSLMLWSEETGRGVVIGTPAGVSMLVGNVVAGDNAVAVGTGVAVGADVQEARKTSISRAAIKVCFTTCALFWRS